MILNIYSVRDNKVGFMNPTVEGSDAIAIRNFEFAVKNSKSLLNSHPQDFDLYKIGSFDSDSGAISGCLPEFVFSASDIFARINKEV